MNQTLTQQETNLELSAKILNEISKVVIDKQDIQELLLTALLSEGHILIEGLPGTAKTLLAKTFAHVIGGQFKRIQFTPDMLPADVTGFYLYTPDGKTRLIEGPLFTNVVLCDELNRTTPRTQAALIEAMQEKQVTIEGETRILPKPFMVIASQLPYGSEGTYPLTEVQADRFMFRAWSDYLGKEYEEQILGRIDYIEQPDIHPIITLEEIMQLQQEVKKVFVSEKVRDYILSLVVQSRQDPDVLTGPSTRASIALFKGARANAYLSGRDYVLPDDVKKLIHPVLDHRIRIKPEAEMEDVTVNTIIERLIKEVPVPKID
ncbi:MAG: MoxR family ATPase [Candidatus Bathyarchaeota archaeon]|nr:MoxR family ATPase [Candidatus Bathyarchaeota archaeon]